MSGHKYISNSNNLFEDDVDDDTFVNSYRGRNAPPPPQRPATSYDGHLAELEQQRQAMLQRQREIEQRTLDSSARSVSILRESEQIGINTAEELVRQREALENTNQRLDQINSDLNTSQKHLNGIKSVFYGLKNYISGKSADTPKSQISPDFRNVKGGPSGSKLENVIQEIPETTRDFESHPSTRLRGLDAQDTSPIPDSQRINQMLDNNLEEMLVSITRLKGLGSALGEEIETQNQLIDKIHDKVEVADLKIGSQNKQINKLLGK